MKPWIVYVVSIVGSLLHPAAATACGCGPALSSVAHHADVVFVGRVARIDHPTPTFHQNADGSITFDSSSAGPDVVLFDIAHVYKGPQVDQLVLRRWNGSCDPPFMTGESWVVYAEEILGGFRALTCSRTRLHHDAAQDVIYLANFEAGRPQGIVFGEVLRYRDGSGGIGLHGLLEPLQVIATDGMHTFSASTDRWGPFELVLPPGEFEIWVERDHRPVAPRRAVHVQNGVDLRLLMRVEYSDTPPHP